MPEPIACSLSVDEVRARDAELLPGLVRKAEAIEMREDGCDLRFRAAGGVLAAIAKVIDAERQCCRFLTFELTVEPAEGPIRLRVSGPPGTGALLSSFIGRLPITSSAHLPESHRAV